MIVFAFAIQVTYCKALKIFLLKNVIQYLVPYKVFKGLWKGLHANFLYKKIYYPL